MAVEVVRGQGRAGSAELVQPVGGVQRGLRAERLGFRDRDRGARDAVLVRGMRRRVDHAPRPHQERLRRILPDHELAHQRHGVGVVGSALDAAVDPGARMAAHEVDRLGDRFAADADIHRGVDDLRQRSHRRRPVEGVAERDHVRSLDGHVLEHGGAASGSALPDAGPVVVQRDARRGRVDQREHDPVLVVPGKGRHGVREQGAGRVELAAVETQPVVLAAKPGAVVVHVLRAGLAQRVAEAAAGQHAPEPMPLLFFRSGQADRLDHKEMVLRDLPQATIGGRDQRRDLGQGAGTHRRTAVLARHGDGPQAARRIALDLVARQAPLAVARRRVAPELTGQRAGDGDRLGVVAYDVRGGGGRSGAHAARSATRRRAAPGCGKARRGPSPNSFSRSVPGRYSVL